MSSTSFTVTKTDLAAALHNVARRYAGIATGLSVTFSGGGATIAITWPDDAPDPGDPGPDPAVVSLGDAVAGVTAQFVAEQARTSNLFAERLDLTAARDAATKERDTLASDKAAALSQLEAKTGEAADLETALVAKQKELDDLKKGVGVVAVDVKP